MPVSNGTIIEKGSCPVCGEFSQWQCSAKCSCDAPKIHHCSKVINFTKTPASGQGLPSCYHTPVHLRGSVPKKCSWQQDCGKLSQEVQSSSLSNCKWTLSCSDLSGVGYVAANQPCLTAQTKSNPSKCVHCQCHDTQKPSKECHCCNDGWASPYFEHRMCYKSASPAKKTIEEASGICKKTESTIATPFSEGNLRFIQNLASKHLFTSSEAEADKLKGHHRQVHV